MDPEKAELYDDYTSGEEPANENYIRINVKKQTKGYVHETTVSLTWRGDISEGAGTLQELLRTSDDLAREEIKRREYADALGMER